LATGTAKGVSTATHAYNIAIRIQNNAPGSASFFTTLDTNLTEILNILIANVTNLNQSGTFRDSVNDGAWLITDTQDNFWITLSVIELIKAQEAVDLLRGGLLDGQLSQGPGGYSITPTQFEYFEELPRVLGINQSYNFDVDRYALFYGLDGSEARDVRTNLHLTTANAWDGSVTPAPFRRAFRLSKPLNLNTFVPSYFTLNAFDKPSKLNIRIYDVDLNGNATTLRSDIGYPFITLTSRNSISRVITNTQHPHERYYWPMYVTKKLGSFSPLSVSLQNTGRRPKHLALNTFKLSVRDSGVSAVVMRVSNVRGEVLSNRERLNEAFAILPVVNDESASDPHADGEMTRVVAQASLAEGPSVRAIEVEFYDLQGGPVDVEASLWFSLIF
jgi:hypothetical protein